MLSSPFMSAPSGILCCSTYHMYTRYFWGRCGKAYCYLLRISIILRSRLQQSQIAEVCTTSLTAVLRYPFSSILTPVLSPYTIISYSWHTTVCRNNTKQQYVQPSLLLFKYCSVRRPTAAGPANQVLREAKQVWQNMLLLYVLVNHRAYNTRS